MFEAFMPQPDPNVAGPSLEELRKRKLMAELLQGRRGPPKIEHPLQGVAHVLDSAFDGMREKRERQRSQAETTQANQINERLVAALGGGVAPAPSAAPSMPAPSAPPATPAAPASSPRPAAFQGSQQDFVAQMMPHAMRVSQQTGIDPRIVIAQSALESGWGRSAPGNNFFGIKSHGQPGGNTLATTEVVNGQPVRTRDSFRAYADMGESADGYARFMQQNPRYRPMLQAQGLDAQIQALGASGYATDPNYAAKIRSIASGISLPQQRAEAPADTMSGSDGMEAPLVDGRTLPPDTQAPALGRPAMSFDEAMPPADPAPPVVAESALPPQAIAQALMSAPVPEPRPPMPAPSVDNMMAGDQGVSAAPTQAPMPQPRPNLEPPPQAMPAGPAPQAIAQALTARPQMNERDRLMMLRDEQSLAPGEADRLRQGLPNPQSIAAVLQGRPMPQATPAPAPMPMAPQQPPQPQGMPQQMQAPQMPPQGVPQAGPQAAPQQPMAQARPPGQIDPALLTAAMRNPQTRALAMQIYQRQVEQNSPQAQAALRQAQAQAEIAERNARAPQNQITTTPDGAIVSIDPRTNQMTVVREPARPPMVVPEGSSVIDPTTGRSIHSSAPQLKPDERAAVTTAEDEGATARSAVAALRQARELNSRAYAGAGATIRGQIAANSPSALGLNEDGNATLMLRNLMTQQVLSSLKAAFGGNPTEGERKILMDVEGAVDQPAAVREQIIDRALKAAEERVARNASRSEGIRSRTYFTPGGAPQAQPASPQPQAADPLSAARAAIQRGAPREAVIQRLRQNGIDPAGL